MDPWRRLKQIGLLVVLVCLIGSIWILFSKILGKLALSWPATMGILACLLVASILILRAIFRSAYLPTSEQVQQVVQEIRSTHARAIESYKGKLHFFFPPHWRTYKRGREGWVLRPKGLGVPVGFSIWATTKDPKFADSSFEGMVKNVKDTTDHHGGQIHNGSIAPRKIAGMDGIEYLLIDLKDHETLGFFWCYENGDYEFLVDASSVEHLKVIRPAIDEFMRYFYMK